MLTERLELRPLRPTDRARFVELFGDAAFMVYSHGPYDAADAARRFEQMLAVGRELAFAKQPIIERTSGVIVGYIGAGRMDIDAVPVLELGYRLIPAVRGRGYATEAGEALLATADATDAGQIVTVIDPTNVASIRTSERLGFRFWEHADVDGDICYIGRRTGGCLELSGRSRAPS